MLTKRNESNRETSCWEYSILGTKDVNKLSVVDRVMLLKTFFSKTYTAQAKSESKISSSRSMVDLREDSQLRRESRRTKSLTSEIWRKVGAIPVKRPVSCLTVREKRNLNEAGRIIFNLLMLNAWRRRKQDNLEARAIVNALTNQICNLNMQVYVLQQLLDNEKTRAALAVKDNQKTLLKIEECEREKLAIMKERENLESVIKELQDLATDLKNKCENQKNDLATARHEAANWENRLKKERKKLKSLQDEKITLQKEAQSKEDLMVLQSQSLEQLNQTNNKLQEELDAQVPILNEAMSQMYSAQEKLKESEELVAIQEKALLQKDEKIKALNAHILVLEKNLQEQDERNGELGKLISEKTKELIMLDDKLGELTKSQKYWGNRVIKMASLCTRIPFACFYTLATMLLPQPSFRSF